MGADRAVHVNCGSEDIADLGPLAVSNIIAKLAAQEKIGLILLGKQVSEHLEVVLYRVLSCVHVFLVFIVRRANFNQPQLSGE